MVEEMRSGDPADTGATVVVCTRNRGERIVGTVRSILAGTVQEFELLIIDQSTEPETRRALEPFLSDPRVRYLASDETGVAKSRSLALSEASHELVVNTDDDCIVAPDWLEANLQVLRDHPDATLVFGDVVAPQVDPDAGYAPESIAHGEFAVASVWRWRSTDGINIGIGASMAMRRSPLLALGAFDHELGPGSQIRTAEDIDLTLRAVLAGHTVIRTTRPRVDHYGHRPHDEFRTLTRASMYGVGATVGKLIRNRPAEAVWYASSVVWQLVIKVAVVDLLHLRRPPVLGRAWHFVRGFWVGLRLPLDPGNRWLFAPGEAE